MTVIRTVLHPTDFSESSEAAFQFACALARDHGARVVVLHVGPPPVTGSEAVDYRRPGGEADDLLARLREIRPADRDVPVDYRLEVGDPADTVLRVAAEERADLIVIGTHGRSGLRRAVLGSVAEAVCRKAACPVATVRAGLGSAAAWAAVEAREVGIPVGPYTRPVILRGVLRWPPNPRGVVVFAHGSDSSRHSPRNQAVAEALTRGGFATLLMDLLEKAEAEDRANVFDVALLADRLAGVAGWLAGEPETAGLPVGYFGASTGAAAALAAAASHPDRVAAVVSRGGRPDLAWDELPAVRAPTLLIVGGADDRVLDWNRQALERLECPKELAVVPAASHLFEEPGALDEVARLARGWFDLHLTAPARGDAAADVAAAD